MHRAVLPFSDTISVGSQGRGSGSGRVEGVLGAPLAPGSFWRTVALFDFFRGGRFGTNRVTACFGRIMIGLGLALLGALMGCVGVGYVDGGYGGAVLVPEPNVYFWGGGYERGHDVHAYSHRGFESRGVAHPGGGGHGGKR